MGDTITSLRLLELRGLLAEVVRQAHDSLHAVARALPGLPDHERCGAWWGVAPAGVLVARRSAACTPYLAWITGSRPAACAISLGTPWQKGGGGREQASWSSMLAARLHHACPTPAPLLDPRTCSKRALLAQLHASRQQLQRVAVATAWSAKARAVAECRRVLETAALHGAALQESADQLAFLHGELAVTAAPPYDVPTALHVTEQGAGAMRLRLCVCVVVGGGGGSNFLGEEGVAPASGGGRATCSRPVLGQA